MERRIDRWLACLLLTACSACSVIDQMTGVEATSRRASAGRHAEEERREAFLRDGDAKAIRWLLAHRVEEGMKLEEVNRILGQDGEREYSDRFVKSGPANFHLDDETYRWGPDDRGRSYYLIFREGQLCNYDPSLYRTTSE